MDDAMCTAQPDSKYVHQQIFKCRSCNLVGNLGLCYVCATKCHPGHDTFYYKYGYLVCNCNEEGNSYCYALDITSTVEQVNTNSSIVMVKDSNAALAFKCPVCLSYMCAPIYLCARGHSVCGECFSKIASCPICRGSLTSVRNLNLETLGEAFEVQCEDCRENVQMSALKSHGKACILNECPLTPQCQWLGMARDFYDHCLDAHPGKLLYGPVQVFQYKFTRKYDREVDILSLSGLLFLFDRKFYTTNFAFICVVKHLNRHDEDYVFSYTINFTSPRGEEGIMFNQNVRPASEKVSDIYKLHRGVTLYMKQATHILQLDTLNYTLNIEKHDKLVTIH